MSADPWLVCEDAAGLLDFLVGVLGATELGRMPGPDGIVGHAEVALGSTRLVVMDARPGWSPAPAQLRVAVDDLAAVVERARMVGARIAVEPVDLPTGERAAVVRDLWGGRWWLVEHPPEAPEVTDLLRRLGEPGAREIVAGFEAALDADQREGWR